MAETDTNPATATRPSIPSRRRSSFAELYASRPPNDPSSATTSITTGGTSPRSARPSHSYILAATANDNYAPSSTQGGTSSTAPRRLSITTLGLSGSPTRSSVASATSPFGTIRRGQGVSENDNRRSFDAGESAVSDDVDSATATSPPQNSPPFARRVSIGARVAYRDMRSASISGASGLGGGGSGVNGISSSMPANGNSDVLGISSADGTANGQLGKSATSPPAGFKEKERFNWSENLRARAERSSISSATGVSFGSTFGSSSNNNGIGGGGGGGVRGGHHRTASTGGLTSGSASSSLPLSQTVSSNGPVPPRNPVPVHKAPDHFQERILKGDFYMD